MLKKPIIAGNWKMNIAPREAGQFFADFKSQLSEEELSHFLFFPPTIDLIVAADSLNDTAVEWGPQNVYWEDSGAYTGENSLAMAKELGASYCLVGHSERRTLFGETDSEISRKVKHIQSKDMTPVLCVGESLVQRESGATESILKSQLVDGLKEVDVEKNMILAYEPVWAIGTGKVATPDQAENAHKFIKSFLSEQYSPEVALRIPVLYGGSVKPDNSKDLSSQENVDGFLIGGASLKVSSLIEIFRSTF